MSRPTFYGFRLDDQRLTAKLDAALAENARIDASIREREQRARYEEVYRAYIRRWFEQTDADRVSTALVTKV